MATRYKPWKVSARAAKSPAYTVPGPSLFEGPNALPKSIGQYTGPRADLLDTEARKIIAEWDAKRTAGMVPVLVTGTGKYGTGAQSVEWRQVAA